MLTKLTTTTVTRICTGRKPDGSICNAENALAFSSLKLGVSNSRVGFKDKDLIVTPLCTTCMKANEIFNRTWDDLPETFPTYRLRAATNFLAKQLKDASQIDAGCLSDVMAETSDPPVILDDWPSGDGTI